MTFSSAVISNIAVLRGQLGPAIEAALAFFPGVDRTVGGYEGLITAQAAISSDEARDASAPRSALWPNCGRP